MSQAEGHIVSIETGDGKVHYYVIQGEDDVTIEEYHPPGEDDESPYQLPSLGEHSEFTHSVAASDALCEDQRDQEPNTQVTSNDVIDANTYHSTDEQASQEHAQTDTGSVLTKHLLSLSEYRVQHTTQPVKRERGAERDVSVSISFVENNVRHKYKLTGRGILFSNNETDVTDTDYSDKKCLVKLDNLVVAMDTNKRVHKCDTCGRVFRHSQHLKSHAKVHEEVKAFRCDVCPREFSHVGNLTTHRKVKHPAAKNFSCTQCTKEFSCTETLQEHKNIHSDKRAFACDVCNKTYHTRKRLLRHRLLHVSDKSHVCKVCDRSFAFATYLKAHMKVHSDNMQFSCEVCHLEFRHRMSYKEHVAKSHLGQIPYKCQFCNKGFARNYNLKLHMRIHTGERPYKCPYCDKTFAGATDLVRHERTHTGERPYKCDICDKAFTQNASLKVHKERHNKSSHVSEKRSDEEKEMDNESDRVFLNEAIRQIAQLMPGGCSN